MTRKARIWFAAFAAMAVLLFAVSAHATVGYLGAPRARFWTSTGTAPLSGGKVVTCSSGASCGCTSYTGKTSYTDSTGGTPNANPVVLDSRGEASIWLDGTYKIAVCTSANVLQWTMDGITGVQDQSVTLSEWNASGLTPTYISATSFSVAGDHTTDFFAVNRRLKTTNTAGTIYSTITASSFGASITTVTVINDSGSLDSGLSAVSVGLMDSANLSAPVPATVTKTDDYVMTAADVNKIFIFNKATAVAATLKAANLVPNGTVITFKNIGAGVLTLTGTVDGVSNPTLAQSHDMVIYSNGTAWYESSHRNSSFAAKRTTNQTVTSGVLTKVQCDIEKWDGNNEYDEVTNFRYQPKRAGKYRLSLSVLAQAATSILTHSGYIYKNGGDEALLWQIASGITGSNPISLSGSAVVEANGTTDYFEAYIYMAGTGTITLNGTASYDGVAIYGEYVGP